MQNYDVIVIGAGAAGMMCAITAANRGRQVLLIEHTKRLGKKILMSGGGRCNFTNLDISPDNFLSQNPHFCKSALRQYTQWDFIALVAKHNIDYYEKSLGQLFCQNSSKDIVKMLEKECTEAGVEIKTQCSVETIQTATDNQNATYQLSTNLGILCCSSLVIATGGLSIPTLGATGFGYRVAEQFGLSIIPTRATLVPFTLTGKVHTLTQKLSGVSLDSCVSYGDVHFSNPLLFTHRGLSGPASLQISNYWQESTPIQIDLSFGKSVVDLLLNEKQHKPHSLVRKTLNKHFPKALINELEHLWWADMKEQPLQQWSHNKLTELGERFHKWQIIPSGTEGYRTAEVTSGGVSTKHLSSKTMECRDQAGLYFIGEVIDVTGWLGGYNFQWAWSSGYVAGMNV